jgi:hypothetical protein
MVERRKLRREHGDVYAHITSRRETCEMNLELMLTTYCTFCTVVFVSAQILPR